MLANYYQDVSSKYSVKAFTKSLQQGLKQTGTMKKSLPLLLLMLAAFLGSNPLKAQMTLSTFPKNICFKDFTSTTVTFNNLPTGVNVDSVYLDYDSDGITDVTLNGPSTYFNNQYKYPTPGPYTITARAKYSNGTFGTETFSGIVYRLPIADFAITNSRIQCFRGNKVEFEDRSIKTDNSIIKLIIVWGDATSDDIDNPFFGQKINKSYTFSNKFLVTWRVIDSVGCESEIISPPNSDKEVIIKNNLNPSFDVLGQRGCLKSYWTLDNTTAGVDFNGLRSYTWDFGDGTRTIRTAPWVLPIDSLNFDTISREYTKSGSFYPALIIEDTTGCIDSLRLNPSSPKVPENINFDFNITHTLNKSDTFPRRDSVCFGNQSATVFFRQTPVDFAGPGDLLWNFGDPPTMRLNFNNQDWWPSHEFSDAKQFIVSLRITVSPCDTTMTDTVDILGPRSRIENPPAMITIDPNQKSQCIINRVVEFPNTSIYYKSNHVFRLWDFGDAIAPRCTSYLVPNTGWPQPGGWVYQAIPPFQQLNNSTGYWTMNGIKYPGKRIDCNFSMDTLPAHRYTDWDVIYQWYRYGHDFMPWDTTRYTKNPADTLPTAVPRKFWVMPFDSLYWGKPVYLNPATGAFSLTQGTWTDPFTGLSQPWPRIDTIDSQNQPQDLEPYNRITMNRGTPDPFSLELGDYAIFPVGGLVDPKNQPGGLSYRSPRTGKLYTYSYDKVLPGQDASKTLYRYIFDREVQRCLTVRLNNKDSQNHMAGDAQLTTDFLVLDSLDCTHEATVQLALTRPDARGLGKWGKECPGKFNQGGNGIRFHLNQTSGELGRFPGINPDCGQTFILLNHDSLADRLDNTPCVLDGFVDWQGGTTAGGLFRPIFSNVADWSDRMQFWTAPTGTSTWYHYGPNTVLGGNALAPADPTGNVTVGLVVGSGNFPNTCISDTVWYHNFFFFKEMNGKFFIDPVTDPNTGVVSSGPCKLYCQNDEITFVYQDSSQDSVRYSAIYWGDNRITVDSFEFAPGVDDGYFVKGARRVRYNFYYGPCGQSPEVIESIIPFPNGLPGVDVDTLWWDNYTFRLYNPATNPNGSLQILGPNLANDSLLINECSKQYWIARKDTLKYWYRPEIRDKALMFLPVKHRYSSTSWEDDCKQANSVPDPVYHVIESMKRCQQIEVDNKLLVRGVIDTAMVRNQKLQFDTIFCANEPVHFYDSVRYWRPDCLPSDPQLNPNQGWELRGVPFGALGEPWDAMHIDTVDYWRRHQDNPDLQWSDGVYVEKLKWYFGDGDSAIGTRPIHKYKNPGKYTVTLVSSDRIRCFDTTYCYVYISEPVSKPTTKPGFYNCGDIVTFFDTSFMKVAPGIELADSIRKTYWWFGERTVDTTKFDGQDIDIAKWNYRRNGYFRIKLVAETYQGCYDTGYTDVYIAGPRPKVALLGDTIGCAPFKVRMVNLADTEGPQTPGNQLTKATLLQWGDKNNTQSKSIQQFDTLEFTYTDTGTYYIFADGDDQDPPQNTGCAIVRYPDTANGNQPPIRIVVKKSYPANVSTNLAKVCVDQPFDIINGSDTSSYDQYMFSIYTGDTATEVKSFIRGNDELKFSSTIDTPGTYLVLLEPTSIKPGLPNCKLYDTVKIEVVEPTAGWTTPDSAGSQSFFKLVNTSFYAGDYTWTAYDAKDRSIIKAGPVDKVEADRDWSYDFGKDTGDVIVCVKAFTLDPAKPICEDEYCDTISYRFIVKLKIYNVFTPNDDGSNDVFDIDIEGETEYDLIIYNRWGTKVFESTDSKKDWNGKNKNDGSDCAEGTYYFIFKYALRNGEKGDVNGTVTLLRKQE